MSQSLHIRPVLTAEDRKAFVMLPFRLYQDDPAWVPPIISHQLEVIDPAKGPFFEVGEARLFLAERDGRVVGRISAHVNHAYEKLHDQETGFFGFFACENDREAAGALFDSARAWLADKKKSKMLGPLSFAIYDDEVGLLVEGYGERPTMMHAYNDPYYEDLLLHYGFAKTFDWFAYKVTEPFAPLEDMIKMRDDFMAKAGVTITHPSRDEFVRRAAEVLDMFNDLWSKNWGHVPLTKKQFESAFTQLKPLLAEDLLGLIEEDGRILAFNAVVPDINISLHKMGGKLSLWNMLKLFWDCRVRPLRGVRSVILGVARDQQWRRLHHALVLDSFITLMTKHPECEYCDCSLIPQSLVKWNKTIQMYNGKRYRTFRLYEKAISA